MPSIPHVHTHSCEVCRYTVAHREVGTKNLKMCPCREAFYCGSEHQTQHWKIHKQTCYNRKNRAPPSAYDAAIGHLIQVQDSVIVEVAVCALVKDDVDRNLRADMETKAVVLTVEQREGKEDMAIAHAAGRLPDFQLSRDVRIVSIEDVARERGLEYSFFENPIDRELRLRLGELAVSFVFYPGGRAVTKRVPAIQMAVFEMIQKKQKEGTFSPNIAWHIDMLNMRIDGEVLQAKKKSGDDTGDQTAGSQVRLLKITREDALAGRSMA